MILRLKRRLLDGPTLALDMAVVAHVICEAVRRSPALVRRKRRHETGEAPEISTAQREATFADGGNFMKPAQASSKEYVARDDRCVRRSTRVIDRAVIGATTGRSQRTEVRPRRRASRPRGP